MAKRGPIAHYRLSREEYGYTIQDLLGGAPYVAVGTPLPVIIPSAIVGGATYARAGEVSWRQLEEIKKAGAREMFVLPVEKMLA